MTQLLFLWENVHFGLYLAAGLACLAVFWLYFDASHGHRTVRGVLGLIGWIILAAGFFLGGAQVETILIDTSFILSPGVLLIVHHSLRLLGYVLILISVWFDPLQPEPKVTGLTKEIVHPPAPPRPKSLFPERSSPVISALTLPLSSVSVFPSSLLFYLASPAAALLVAFAYLRRATTGLERHIRPLAAVYGLLTLFELTAMSHLLRASTSPSLYALSQPFGFLWALEHIFLGVATTLLIWWVAQYLLRRFQTQLLMVFIGITVTVFLITTVSFTLLLQSNIKQSTLDRLLADARALDHSLQGIRQQTVSDAALLTQDPRLASLLETRATTELNQLVASFITTKNRQTIVITDAEGAVLIDLTNPENIGASLSDHPYIRRARQQETVSGIISEEGPVGPLLLLRAAAPVRAGDTLLGTVMTGTILDNAYLDTLKSATGLDVALYAGDILAASTITTSDNEFERWLGTKATDQVALARILNDNESYTGSTTLVNTPLLAAFIPLHDIDNRPIGALQVGIREQEVLRAAGRSLQLTFVTSTLLMVLSLLPSLMMARRLARQAK